MAPTQVLVALLLLMFNSEVGARLSDLSSPVFIIGGNSTDIKQHPFQVAIWSSGEFRGSGALVAKGWAITTASIVVGFDAHTFGVRAHSSFASSGGEMYNVTKVVIHPKFRFSNMTFDVALLKLEKPLMLTSPSRGRVTSRGWIPLARRPLPTNSTALLSGWGSTTMWAEMSEQLLQTSMRPVSTPECQAEYRRRLLHTHFCAIAEDVYGPCWGDSGDLLVYEGRLHGLLSWNRGCYDEVVPSVFTAMHAVYHWALKTIKRHAHIQPHMSPQETKYTNRL